MWRKRNDRRRPENAERRRQFERDQKNNALAELSVANSLTRKNAERIERLRRLVSARHRGWI